MCYAGGTFTCPIEACKGSKIKLQLRIDAENISKITVKSNKLYGKNYSYKLGSLIPYQDMESHYRFLYITFTPTSSKTSSFIIKDKYGHSILLNCEVDLHDHEYHPYVDDPRKESTALATGYEVQHCYYCGKKRTITLPKLTAYIEVPSTYKVKIGKKERIAVALADGDYITSVTATKNGKTTIVKVFKKSNCFWVQGVNAGTSKVTVKTKAGKKATCKVKVY